MERQASTKISENSTRGNHVQKWSARPSSSAHSLLTLQRSIGNRAVQRLINSPRIQAKLQVSTAPAQILQRDLSTPPPAVPPPAQPELTAEQIQSAIAFNRARYNRSNTRLIQRVLGGPVTGVWTEGNIEAIANTQEQYGLPKDGRVSDATFRFLNNEQRLERMSTSTENCLTSFRVIGPDRAQFDRVSPTECRVRGNFRTEAQFSPRCNCSQFQYRQFIRGHFRRTRGGVEQDIADRFDTQPGGRLPEDFAEDGDTHDSPVHFGHRDEGGDTSPEDRYLNNAGVQDQPNGCRYRSADGPGGVITDCRPGDSYDINVNFRGDIERNGTPVQSRFWTAIRRNNWTP